MFSNGPFSGNMLIFGGLFVVDWYTDLLLLFLLFLMYTNLIAPLKYTAVLKTKLLEIMLQTFLGEQALVVGDSEEEQPMEEVKEEEEELSQEQAEQGEELTEEQAEEDEVPSQEEAEEEELEEEVSAEDACSAARALSISLKEFTLRPGWVAPSH